MARGFPMDQNTNNQAPTLDIELDLDLDRDVFLRELTGRLAETLENVVGLDEASGFVSIVGQQVGEWILGDYRHALKTGDLDRDQVAAVLVDLKRRIQGDFYLIAVEPDKIVLGNRQCPFGDRVKGRPSLCMMTTNVFGTIAAENLGYARVCLHETIARGDDGCRVTIHLADDAPARKHDGVEFYPSEHDD